VENLHENIEAQLIARIYEKNARRGEKVSRPQTSDSNVHATFSRPEMDLSGRLVARSKKI
jgi:hypothetical protein